MLFLKLFTLLYQLSMFCHFVVSYNFLSCNTNTTMALTHTKGESVRGASATVETLRVQEQTE